MQLVHILHNNSIELTLTDEHGNLGFICPATSKEITQAMIDEAVESIQGIFETVVTTELPVKLPAPEQFFANNVETPFLATELLTVTYLFNGMTISVNGNQFFIPNKVLDNPQEYFDKVPGMTAFVLKGTTTIYPDVVVLWKSLGDKHPLKFVDTALTVMTEGFTYEKTNTIEIDQYEVHVSKLEVDNDEEMDVLIAVDKMDPEISHVMYVNVANIVMHGDHESLGRAATWTKYLSPPALTDQDIFGRALRELDFLRF